MKILLNILLILGVAFGAFVIYVWNFGLFPQYLTIQWREEVRLHDGSVIWMAVRKTYERPGMRLDRYERLIFRRNEYTFNVSASTPPHTFSSRLGVRMIDKIGDHWYVVLIGEGPFGNYPDEMPTRWGSDFTEAFERVARLDGSQFNPVSWDDVPRDALRVSNLMVAAVPRHRLVQMAGKDLTTLEKESLLRAYPGVPDGRRILRPLRMRASSKGG